MFWNGVALLCGWTIFFYWWWVVLDHTARPVFWNVLTALLFVVAVLYVLSLYWIAYNIRLARRGRRNRATHYHPGTFERDKLDRPVVFEDLHVLRASPVVVVEATSDRKLYVPGAPGEGA